jgi:hypothetical protein
MRWEMDYPKALSACFVGVLSMDKNPSLLLSYPVPSAEDWARCRSDLEHQCGEDPDNPFDCMGQYQFLLHTQGLSTALAEYVEEIRQVARDYVIPTEYLIQHSKFLPWPSRLVRQIFDEFSPDRFCDRVKANRTLVLAQQERRCQMAEWVIRQRWPLEWDVLPSAEIALKQLIVTLKTDIDAWLLKHDAAGGEPGRSHVQDLFIALFKWNGPASSEWTNKLGPSSPLNGLAMRDLYLIEGWSAVQAARRCIVGAATSVRDALGAVRLAESAEKMLELANCPLYDEPMTTHETATWGEDHVVRFNYPSDLSAMVAGLSSESSK